jgi:D-beta-D-heptose 7-phosphate kinase/D-beta-D-heptose 1-phosphate adenosyltransferase
MIAIIGDILLDEYIYTKRTRPSPEQKNAPVLLVNNKEYALGGAANVAMNLKYLNKFPVLFTSISSDPSSYELTKLLFNHNIKVYNVPNSSKTIVKSRIFDNNNYIARIDTEELVSYDEVFLVEMLLGFDNQYTIISDYGKGTITKPKDIIKGTKAKVLVDPKKKFEEYEGAYLLKANQTEFESWSGEALHNETQLSKLVKDLDIDTVVVTMGEDGCIFTSRSHHSKGYIRSPKIEVNSVIGAGDSFLAGLTYGLTNKQSLPNALVTANKIASISVSKKGTSYVREDEIVGIS